MIAALVLTAIGAALSAVSLVGPWWGASVAAAGVPSSGVGFYSTDLWGMESTVIKTGNQSIPAGPWDSMQSSPLARVHLTTRILAYVAVAGAAVAALLCALGLMKKIKPRGAGGAALAMGFLMLAAPVYFASTVGGAWQAHASGVQPEDSISSFLGFTIVAGSYAGTMSWGPGLGWWVLVIGAVLSLIGSALAMGKEKEEAPAPAAPGQPAPPAAPAGTAATASAAPVAATQTAAASPAPASAPATTPVPYAMPYPAPYGVAPVAVPSGACPTCGTAVRWVPETSRWWCDRCARYPWG
jgi:hypothetical protein